MEDYKHEIDFEKFEYVLQGLMVEIQRLKNRVSELEGSLEIQPSNILKSAQVRQILGISEKTLLDHENNGVIKFSQLKRGGIKRYTRQHLYEVLTPWIRQENILMKGRPFPMKG